MGTTAALATEAIRDHILSFIDHPRTLANLARTNRLWFAAAVPRLWRGTPHLGDGWQTPPLSVVHQACHRSPERGALYIKSIRYLDLSDPSFFFCDICSRVSWSSTVAKHARPEWIDTRDGCIVHGKRFLHRLLAQPLRSNLECLSICHLTSWNDILGLLRRQAPSLRWLGISSVQFEHDHGITPQTLLEFFEATPTLEYIELPRHIEHLVDRALIQHLMRRPRLKVLSLYAEIPEDLIPGCVAEGAVCFPDLISFASYHNASSSWRTLLWHLRGLRDIQLATDGGRVPSDNNSNLRSILDSLTYCRDLEGFSLSTNAWSFDGDFERLARSCPRIRTFEFEWKMFVGTFGARPRRAC